jgi:transcriptional regulator with GAF, ATPase, and Fis domain
MSEKQDPEKIVREIHTATAERLGLKRSTLQSRMKKLGIRRPTG